MVNSCCAINCTNRFSKDRKLGFFRFPRDSERRKLWIQALKRKDYNPTEEHRICGEHFQTGKPSSFPSDPDYIPNVFSFKPSDSSAVKFKKRKEKRRLITCTTVSSTQCSGANTSCLDPSVDCQPHAPHLESGSFHMNNGFEIAVILRPSMKSSSRTSIRKSRTRKRGKKSMSQRKRRAREKIQIQFEKFPANEQLQTQSVNAVKSVNCNPTKTSQLCSHHFSDNEVDRNSRFTVRVQEKATPSIFDSQKHLKEVIKQEQPEITNSPSLVEECGISTLKFRIENTMHVDSYGTKSDDDGRQCRNSNSESHIIIKEEVISDSEMNGPSVGESVPVSSVDNLLPSSTVDYPSSVSSTAMNTLNSKRTIGGSSTLADRTSPEGGSKPVYQNILSLGDKNYESRIAELQCKVDRLQHLRVQDRKKIIALQQTIRRRNKKIAFLEKLVDCDKLKYIPDDDTLDMLEGELKETGMLTVLQMP